MSKSKYKEKELIRLKRQKRMSEKLTRIRIGKQAFLGIMFILCIMYLTGVVFYEKIVHGEEYEAKALEKALNQAGLELILTPDRGNILTRDHQVLATSLPIYNIALDIVKLNMEKKEEDIEKILTNISELLEIDKSVLHSYLAKDEKGELINQSYWKIIAKEVSQAKEKEIKDAKNLKLDEGGIRHVYSEKVPRRVYPHNNLAAGLIGFIRGASWGLEHQYDKELTGAYGRQLYAFDIDENITTQKVDPIDGLTTVSTIDFTIQQFAEESARKGYEQYNCERSVILVMNPNTGEILAMAQHPSVNLNYPTDLEQVNSDSFIEKVKNLDEQEIMNKLFGIQSNFIVSKTYEPGSIFKPMVIAAALEENVITLDDVFYCKGFEIVAGERINCWHRNGHGSLNAMGILSNSCNVGMMQIVEKMGKEMFYKYQREFGFGYKTGIDLPSEEGAESLMHHLSGLNPVELATGSMGQGFNVTTIQVLNAFAATINGGKVMKPYVVSQLIDKNNNVVYTREPELVNRVISEETSDILRIILQKVVSEGTGKLADIQGYNIGGKTGTGQQGKRDEGINTVSFVGYFPVESPEIIAIALLDRTKDKVTEGSSSAAPMLKELMLNIINYKNIKPSGEVSDIEIFFSNGENITVDNYKGLDTAEATKKLNSIGLDYEIIGKGDLVENQSISEGEKVSKDSKIYLYVVDNGGRLTFVPNLEGMPIDDAIIMCEGANLTYFISEMKDDDESDESYKKVYEQSPSADLKVKEGTQVKLKVK